MIPAYRRKEIRSLYEVFEFRSEHLSLRKQEFKKALRVHYTWARASELEDFYKLVYKAELSLECSKHATEAVEGLKADLLELFGALDEDKNGVIDYYEFTHGDAHMQDLFGAMDVNRDGQVTVEEFVGYVRDHLHVVEAMRAHVARAKSAASRARINALSVLFKKFPASPTTPGSGWRPDLSALHSPETLRRKCTAARGFGHERPARVSPSEAS